MNCFYSGEECSKGAGLISKAGIHVASMEFPEVRYPIISAYLNLNRGAIDARFTRIYNVNLRLVCDYKL